MSRNSKPKTRPAAAGSRTLESQSHPAGWPDRWPVLGVCLFLTAAIWFVFGRTLHHDFINFDDNVYVNENPVVKQGLTFKGLVWAFAGIHSANWHPLTWFSHMLDCQLYGLNPGGHHLTNILIHTATAILLFLVLRQMTATLWRSAFVAAVFAVHPLRVESVAWVAERKDVLSGMFFMLTIGAYVRYAQGRSRVVGRGSEAGSGRLALEPRSSTFDYYLVLLFFALGLLSKPMLVTLPFVLLLLDYWPLNRWRAEALMPKRLVVEKLPLFGLAAALCAATLFAQQVAVLPLPFSTRLGNALVSYVVYLGQMFYPAGLVVFYPHPGSSLELWKIMASVVLLLAISVVALAGRRKHPYFLFGWLWYAGMLVPVIGIVQVGWQAHADRYTYLPQIGLYIALTWAAADLCVGWHYHRAVLGGIATAILAALMFLASVQTAYWRNSESLWTRALACTSNNFVAYNNLGNALFLRGDVDHAIAYYQKALQINSRYPETYNNLGDALLQEGSVDEAIAYYQQALQIRPGHAGVQNNLGYALFQKGNVDEAIVHYRKALEINPGYAEADNNLGNALLQKGSVDEAMIHYQKALQIKPGDAEADNNLGNALLQKGKVDEATVYFQKALQINPHSAEFQNNLGYALFQKGKVDEAIAHYQMALQINPDHLKVLNNLGNALLQKGNWDEAIVCYQKASQIKPDDADIQNDLGNALLQKGDAGEAIVHYQKALQIKPDYLEAQNNLAGVLATSPSASLRNGPQAVELAQRANQLAGGENPIILHTLAAAYAEVGRFDDARRNVEKAIELAQAAGQPDLVKQLNVELKLYEAGQPFHLKSK